MANNKHFYADFPINISEVNHVQMKNGMHILNLIMYAHTKQKTSWLILKSQRDSCLQQTWFRIRHASSSWIYSSIQNTKWLFRQFNRLHVIDITSHHYYDIWWCTEQHTQKSSNRFRFSHNWLRVHMYVKSDDVKLFRNARFSVNWQFWYSMCIEFYFLILIEFGCIKWWIN